MANEKQCEHSPWMSVYVAFVYVLTWGLMAGAAGAILGFFVGCAVWGYRLIAG